jgi:predicted DNA-binding transcriptional regulator YafY
MLQILRNLQSSGGLNADQLAAQLEVCRRTVFRDLNVLRQAGVDIQYDERLDCYRLATYTHPLATPELNPHELTTLLAAAHLSVLRNADDCARLLRQSVDKLLAQAPPKVRQDAWRVVNACCPRTASTPPVPTLLSVTHHVLAALAQRRTLRVMVREPGQAVDRQTDLAPYQLIAAHDIWQIVGRSSLHGDVRMFDPRDLNCPQLTDEIYAIPPRFQTGVGSMHIPDEP